MREGTWKPLDESNTSLLGRLLKGEKGAIIVYSRGKRNDYSLYAITFQRLFYQQTTWWEADHDICNYYVHTCCKKKSDT